MQKLLLIDADFILWKCCPNVTFSETEIMYGVKNEKTLQETLDLVDWYLREKIFIPTQADYYIGFLGGTGNFRMSISTEYKANRVDKVFPNYFYEAKQYLLDKWKFVKIDNIEAEDAVGITLHSSDMFISDAYQCDWIIVRNDHDLDQLPGTHFNPAKNEWKEISKEEAVYNFWKQMLTGCTTDRVQGIPRIGHVKADKLLNGFPTEALMYEVLDQYISFYGEYNGIQKFAENYKLLRILRSKEDFVIPEIQSLHSKQETIIDESIQF